MFLTSSLALARSQCQAIDGFDGFDLWSPASLEKWLYRVLKFADFFTEAMFGKVVASLTVQADKLRDILPSLDTCVTEDTFTAHFA